MAGKPAEDARGPRNRIVESILKELAIGGGVGGLAGGAARASAALTLKKDVEKAGGQGAKYGAVGGLASGGLFGLIDSLLPGSLAFDGKGEASAINARADAATAAAKAKVKDVTKIIDDSRAKVSPWRRWLPFAENAPAPEEEAKLRVEATAEHARQQAAFNEEIETIKAEQAGAIALVDDRNRFARSAARSGIGALVGGLTGAASNRAVRTLKGRDDSPDDVRRRAISAGISGAIGGASAGLADAALIGKMARKPEEPMLKQEQARRKPRRSLRR